MIYAADNGLLRCERIVIAPQKVMFCDTEGRVWRNEAVFLYVYLVKALIMSGLCLRRILLVTWGNICVLTDHGPSGCVRRIRYSSGIVHVA